MIYGRVGRASSNKICRYCRSCKAEFGFLFDIIILKDVIEHIPDQDRFIPKLKDFLSDDGVIFCISPGGCLSRASADMQSQTAARAAMVPLLPLPIYKAILSAFGEKDATMAELLDIRSTGINIVLYTITVPINIKSSHRSSGLPIRFISLNSE
ncbi:MAG: hypothetical protein IPL08_13950 [Saprospiraceae bacterium]|nr:hypothetical protein [Saprospiraceae bacterium]